MRPRLSALVDSDAAPDTTATGLPRLVAPSANWTLPTAVDGLTVAASVTAVPKSTGAAGVSTSVVVVVVAGTGLTT